MEVNYFSGNGLVLKVPTACAHTSHLCAYIKGFGGKMLSILYGPLHPFSWWINSYFTHVLKGHLLSFKWQPVKAFWHFLSKSGISIRDGHCLNSIVSLIKDNLFKASGQKLRKRACINITDSLALCWHCLQIPSTHTDPFPEGHSRISSEYPLSVRSLRPCLDSRRR